MTDAQLLDLVAATREHLGPTERLTVHRAASQQPERFADQMNLYAGQSMSRSAFAALVLRIANAINTSGPQ